MFCCEYCETFKNTFFLQNTSGGCFCNVQVIVLRNLAQADQNKIVYVIFLQNHCCALRANIAQVIFLCNVVSDVFGQHWVYDFPLQKQSSGGVLFLKGVLKSLTKFTEKHLCQSVFLNKVAGLRHVTFLKKRLWHRYFLVNLAKFLRTPFFTEHV